MIKVQHTILIRRPVHDVFAFVANYENDPQWRSEVRSMRNMPTAPIGLGTQTVEISQVMGQHLETTTMITEWEPDHRVVSQTTAGRIPLVSTRLVEPAGTGTALTYRLEGDERGVFVFRLVRPLLERWYQRKVEGYLQTLKRRLEAAGPARPKPA